MKNLKTISVGTVNDAKVYAILAEGRLYPLSKEDMEFESPDYLILCDSGSYPSITDVDQYICDKAMQALGL